MELLFNFYLYKFLCTASLQRMPPNKDPCEPAARSRYSADKKHGPGARPRLQYNHLGETTVELGVFIFDTDYSMSIEELARALEDRGFASLFVPEHTHIPASRTSPWAITSRE